MDNYFCKDIACEVFVFHYIFVSRRASYVPSVLEHIFPAVLYNLVYAFSLYFSIKYDYLVNQRFLACFYMMLIALVLYRNFKAPELASTR